MRSGECWAHTIAELPIVATASGLSGIPTPTKGDSKQSGSRNTSNSKANPGVSLTDFVKGDSGTGRKLWPTPTTYRGPNEGNVRLLRGLIDDGITTREEAAAMIGADPYRKQGIVPERKTVPTPAATDWKGSSKPGQRRGQLTDPAMGVIPAGGRLNPTGGEGRMGGPLGWTDLEPLEMDKYQSALHTLSKSFQGSGDE